MLRTLRALLELLRLPNLFTVPGDILVGWTVANGTGALPWYGILASLCLYSAGLLFNDFFDATIDAAERPSRPIPSGRISRNMVGVLATFLMVCGIVLARQAWWMALLLAGLILAYDGGFKKIPVIGILTMGACRGVNILLGAVYAGTTLFNSSAALGVAGCFMAYIVLVSLIARNEVCYPGLPKLVALLLRLLIPLQCLAYCLTASEGVSPALLFTFALLWVGAEVSGRRFSGS